MINPPTRENRSTAKGFASGDRHGWLDELCGHLQAAIWAAGAADLLADRATWPTRGAVLTLPCWRWAVPAADVGRKSRAADGGTLLLPARVAWDPGAGVLVPQGRSVPASWRTAGLGLGDGGGALLACTRHPEVRLDPRTWLPDRVTATAATRTGMAHDLARITAAGRAARWDLLQMLEPYVRSAVVRGHARVAAEVAGESNHSGPRVVLDDTDQEVVIDTLLLGEGAGPGHVARMLDRCLRPGTFTRVDPLRYIAVTLRRDAEQEIRRRIGDPRIGRKVRALHRLHPGICLPDLVERYRALHPQDRLTPRQAAAALETSLRVRVGVDEAFRPARQRRTAAGHRRADTG